MTNKDNQNQKLDTSDAKLKSTENSNHKNTVSTEERKNAAAAAVDNSTRDAVRNQSDRASFNNNNIFNGPNDDSNLFDSLRNRVKRIVRGIKPFSGIDSNGERREYRPGSEVEVTPQQAIAFADVLVDPKVMDAEQAVKEASNIQNDDLVDAQNKLAEVSEQAKKDLEATAAEAGVLTPAQRIADENAKLGPQSEVNPPSKVVPNNVPANTASSTANAASGEKSDVNATNTPSKK